MKAMMLSDGSLTILDDQDYDFYSQWTYNNSKGYAMRSANIEGKKVSIYLHREILELKPKEIGDHINGYTWDNRRCNLRKTDRTGNARNSRGNVGGTSKYKGVSFHTKRKKWIAQIVINNKPKHIGYFLDELDAARAYDKAAIIYHGEYARLNFPEVQP